MSGAQKAGVIALGLVGLYLLSGRAGGGASGGFGGGGGADREPISDTIINFPEMDLSSLWSDEGAFEAKKTPTDSGVDYFQYLKSIGERPTLGEEGDIMTASQFDISDYRTTSKKLAQTPVTSPALARQAGFRDMFAGWFSRAGAARYGQQAAAKKQIIPRQTTGGSRLRFYEYTHVGAHEGTLSRGRTSPIRRLNV